MPIIRHLLMQVARRAASDPRVRAKAAEIFDAEIKPRAAAAWAETKPKLQEAGRDVKDIARENDPRRDPKAFATAVKRRFVDGEPVNNKKTKH